MKILHLLLRLLRLLHLNLHLLQLQRVPQRCPLPLKPKPKLRLLQQQTLTSLNKLSRESMSLKQVPLPHRVRKDNNRHLLSPLRQVFQVLQVRLYHGNLQPLPATPLTYARLGLL